MHTRLRLGQQCLQLQHVLRKRFSGGGIAPHRPHRMLIGTRGAAEAEIDPAVVQRRERAELFGDHERRVVGQHDAAGADPDRFRSAGDVADDNRGGGARDTAHVVVFGDPVARVAERFGVPGKVAGVVERLAGVCLFSYADEIED
jgi:hypothetical protein